MTCRAQPYISSRAVWRSGARAGSLAAASSRTACSGAHCRAMPEVIVANRRSSAAGSGSARISARTGSLPSTEFPSIAARRASASSWALDPTANTVGRDTSARVAIWSMVVRA